MENKMTFDIVILLDSSFDLQTLKTYIQKNTASKVITFDYFSHKSLLTNSIDHTISDNYIDSETFSTLQELSHKMSQWSKESEFSNIFEYESINIPQLFYRDFQHSLLPSLKKIYEISRIYDSIMNCHYVVSPSLFEIVNLFTTNVEKLNSSSNESDQLLNQYVKYQFKFANSSFSLNLSREKYRSLKSFSEKIIHKFFGPKSSHSFTNVLVGEFDPIKFKNLFMSSNNSDVSLCLYNRRRPSIWNKQSYSIVKNSNVQILSPSMLDKNIQKKCNSIFEIYKKSIDEYFNNSEFFSKYFSFEGVSIWLILKPILQEFFQNRVKESIFEIEFAKQVFEKFPIDSILIQNESGFTEQILIHFGVAKKIPIYLISHGLSYENLNTNYHKRRLFDGVDPILSSKYLVWGNVQYQFAKDYGISESQLEIIGSPFHDSVFLDSQNSSSDYVLLATSSPTASLIQDLTVETLEKYENTIRKICQIVINSNKKLIIKLHPFQEELDITKIVHDISSEIEIIKYGDIVSLIKNCSLFITIDISTTILDAQILSKPIISVQVKNYDWDAPKIFESESYLVSSLNTLEQDFEKITKNSQLQINQSNNAKKFLNNYFSHQGSSSKNLIKFLSKPSS
jgi:hypothetical protein